MRGPEVISTFHNIGIELLDDLQKLILRMSESTGRYPTTNIGGWKSDEKFFDTPHIAVRRLRHDLERFVVGLNITGWAMVNREGCYHPRHQHTNVLLSGVYYVDPGDPVTPTVFEDSRGEEITPPQIMAGTLVTFPENMWHYVPIYQGTKPRITIVLNAKREDNLTISRHA